MAVATAWLPWAARGAGAAELHLGAARGELKNSFDLLSGFSVSVFTKMLMSSLQNKLFAGVFIKAAGPEAMQSWDIFFHRFLGFSVFVLFLFVFLKVKLPSLYILQDYNRVIFFKIQGKQNPPPRLLF